MYKIVNNKFVGENGQVSSFIVTELITDEVLLEKQNNSIKEYEQTHEKEEYSDFIKDVY